MCQHPKPQRYALAEGVYIFKRVVLAKAYSQRAVSLFAAEPHRA